MLVKIKKPHSLDAKGRTLAAMGVTIKNLHRVFYFNHHISLHKDIIEK